MKFKYLTDRERDTLMRDFLAQLEAMQLKDAVNNLLNINANLTIEQKIALIEKFKGELNGSIGSP